MSDQKRPDELSGPGAGLSATGRQADDFSASEPGGTDYGGSGFGAEAQTDSPDNQADNPPAAAEET